MVKQFKNPLCKGISGTNRYNRPIHYAIKGVSVKRIYRIPPLILAGLIAVSLTRAPEACTRVLHLFPEQNLTLTARSMDWYVRYPTSLWKFPRGMQRNGLTKKNPARWISRYGSLALVQTADGQSATADGINEKGLVANLLYLSETEYPRRDTKIPGVASSIFLQYLLDNFATVAEAVAFLEKDAVQIVPVPIPNSEHLPTMHIALSDASGDSAVIEFLDGKTVIHHDRAYQVMANSPTYEKQLALTAYWNEIGDVFLPGTRKSPDRFVRADYYNRKLPKPESYEEAVASLLSIMRNVSSPFGEADPQKPNISTTMWRVVHDQSNLRLFYESTIAPNVVWVDLSGFDFAPGTPVKSLDMENGKLNGNVTKRFEKSEALEFARP
jgi:choloylglycine hydrolase